MGLEPEVPEVEEVEEVVEVVEGEQPDAPDEVETPNDTEAVETEVIAAPTEAPKDTNLVKHLRKMLNDQKKEISDLRKSAPAPAAAKPQPRLDDADIDFNEDTYQVAMKQWILDNMEHEKSAEKAKQAAQAQQETWNTKVAKYIKEKASRGDEAELAQDIVEAVTSQAQQAVIIQAAQNPAAFVHGLSKRDDLLEIASKITDPIEFAAFVARTEANMYKLARPKPPAESVVRSAGGAMPSTNLATLQEEARKTGDYTKFFAAKSLQASKK